jgi:serine/threonine protein kinase
MGRRFRSQEVARLFVAADQGLHDGRIDGQRFTHGDAKPDNIFVRFDPVTQQAIFAVGDLGTASKMGEPVAGSLTPEYAPNDQQSGVATTKHDPFAFSAIGYEMCTGRPFRDDVIIPATDARPRIEDRYCAIRHESGYRSIPGQPQWEMILSAGYDPDPERRCEMVGLAARAQAFLRTEPERASIRPQDLTRYADFLSRDRTDHDRHFASVDRAAADALLRDPRLDEGSRNKLVAARRQMVAAPRPEVDARIVALADRENSCRQDQLAAAASKIQDLKATPQHQPRTLGSGRQSFTAWEAQRRLETSREADPTRGPPSRGPTR